MIVITDRDGRHQQVTQQTHLLPEEFEFYSAEPISMSVFKTKPMIFDVGVAFFGYESAACRFIVA